MSGIPTVGENYALGSSDLDRAGFRLVSRSTVSGSTVELWSDNHGFCIAALVTNTGNHWKARGLSLIRQEWRWLRTLWGRSSFIRKGRTWQQNSLK